MTSAGLTSVMSVEDTSYHSHAPSQSIKEAS
jgi:hypothetical protein